MARSILSRAGRSTRSRPNQANEPKPPKAGTEADGIVSGETVTLGAAGRAEAKTSDKS